MSIVPRGWTRSAGRVGATVVLGSLLLLCAVYVSFHEAPANTPRRSLSLTKVSSADLAYLAIDMCMQGLNTGNTFLVRNSTAGRLRDTLLSRLEQVKAVRGIGVRTTENSGRPPSAGLAPRLGLFFEVTGLNGVESRRSAIGRTSLWLDGQQCLDTTATITVEKTASGWRVTDGPLLERALQLAGTARER